MSAGLPAELEDAKLKTLREQLGETLWSSRVEQARERELLLSRASQLCEQGHSAAAAAAACDVTVGTLAQWRSRYARMGLAGLIARTGRVAVKPPSGPVAVPGQARRATRPALSFVKWAGAKRGSLASILNTVPAQYGTYFEPFVGSGTVFQALRPAGRVVLSDSNAELMTAFRVIRDDVEALIAALQRHVNTREHFTFMRGIDPAGLSPVECAARFIFLNKTCFNGLYRVNASGIFNVPYGNIGHANVCDVATLQRWATLLHGAELHHSDYREVLADAKRGDLIYLDPPYLRRKRSTAGAVRYNALDFDLDAHRELADVVRDLDRRGCHLIASNADLPEVRHLYRGFVARSLRVRRQINMDANGRAGHSELLITNVRRRAVQLQLPHHDPGPTPPRRSRSRPPGQATRPRQASADQEAQR